MSFSLELPLPDWLDAYLSPPRRLDGPAACMALAVELSAQNILNQTGGPFGAVVVDARTGELLGVGVNLVVRSGLTMAHAEMVALAVAQLRLHAAGGRGNRQLLLATSAEPCAMCLGGIHWAGVSSVLIGARDGLCNPSCPRAIAERYGAPFRVHPTGGHDLSTDDPAWMAEQVRDWVGASAGG